MKNLLKIFALFCLFFGAPQAQAASENEMHQLELTVANIEWNDIEDLVQLGVFTIDEAGNADVKNGMTRAEFVQKVMSYVHPNASQNSRCFDLLDPDLRPGFAYNLLFSDVSVFAPYATELCTAMITGVVNGYRDGSFRPNDRISLAEAAKILNVAFGLEYTMPDYDYEVWYTSYVDQLEKRSAVPDSVQNYIEEMTREQATQTLTSTLQSLRENPVTYPTELFK